MATPVLLVHGWAGSFETSWVKPGFTALLEDAGRSVIGVDLLGHGTAPKPHDPAAYADLTGRVADVLPDEPVEAIGFSMGAATLLRLAVARPQAFRRLVLAGIGDRVVAEFAEGRTLATTRSLIDALESEQPPESGTQRLMVRLASQAGNDRAALAAVMKGRRDIPMTVAEIARVTCPTLVVMGDRDTNGPAEQFAGAFPNGQLKVLPGVDHFATPNSFEFIDATLEFIGAAP